MTKAYLVFKERGGILFSLHIPGSGYPSYMGLEILNAVRGVDTLQADLKAYVKAEKARPDYREEDLDPAWYCGKTKEDLDLSLDYVYEFSRTGFTLYTPSDAYFGGVRGPKAFALPLRSDDSLALLRTIFQCSVGIGEHLAAERKDYRAEQECPWPYIQQAIRSGKEHAQLCEDLRRYAEDYERPRFYLDCTHSEPMPDTYALNLHRGGNEAWGPGTPALQFTLHYADYLDEGTIYLKYPTATNFLLEASGDPVGFPLLGKKAKDRKKAAMKDFRSTLVRYIKEQEDQLDVLLDAITLLNAAQAQVTDLFAKAPTDGIEWLQSIDPRADIVEPIPPEKLSISLPVLGRFRVLQYVWLRAMQMLLKGKDMSRFTYLASDMERWFVEAVKPASMVITLMETGNLVNIRNLLTGSKSGKIPFPKEMYGILRGKDGAYALYPDEAPGITLPDPHGGQEGYEEMFRKALETWTDANLAVPDREPAVCFRPPFSPVVRTAYLEVLRYDQCGPVNATGGFLVQDGKVGIAIRDTDSEEVLGSEADLDRMCGYPLSLVPELRNGGRRLLPPSLEVNTGYSIDGLSRLFHRTTRPLLTVPDGWVGVRSTFRCGDETILICPRDMAEETLHSAMDNQDRDCPFCAQRKGAAART